MLPSWKISQIVDAKGPLISSFDVGTELRVKFGSNPFSPTKYPGVSAWGLDLHPRPSHSSEVAEFLHARRPGAANGSNVTAMADVNFAQVLKPPREFDL